MKRTLTAQQLTAFADVLSDYSGDGDLPTVLTDYSGRSMYGKQCLAVVLDDASLAPAVTAELAYVLVEDREPAEFIDLMWSLPVSTDSMGHRAVIYWPNVQAPNATGED